MATVLQQVRNNLVAIVSLVVAFGALGYNTWRNERTEHNRNVREAGLELLREIASLQQIIFYAHFGERDELDRPDQRGDPRMGWVDVITINDLASVMPPAVIEEAEDLRTVWDADSAALIEDERAFQRIDHAIEELRQATLASLRDLS